jgi:S1-C subfamily serine protease
VNQHADHRQQEGGGKELGHAKDAHLGAQGLDQGQQHAADGELEQQQRYRRHQRQEVVARRDAPGEEQRQAEVKGGLLVEQSGGAAKRAGIRPGDIIVAVNGQSIAEIDQLRGIIAKSGKKAAILIERGDSRIFIPVDLG